MGIRYSDIFNISKGFPVASARRPPFFTFIWLHKLKGAQDHHGSAKSLGEQCGTVQLAAGIGVDVLVRSMW